MNSETKVFKAIRASTNGSMKTVVALLVGAGIAWGAMRTQVSTLNADSIQNKKEHAEYREDIGDISDRLSRIEGKLEIALAKK